MLPVIRLEAALQVNPICLSEAAQSASRTIVTFGAGSEKWAGDTALFLS